MLFFFKVLDLWVCWKNNIVHFEDRCSYPKEKNKMFCSRSTSQKNKGTGGLVLKKSKIWEWQKFLANGVIGESKNRPGENFGHIVHPTSRNFNFNWKPKSYADSNLYNAEKSKIMVAPPFGRECPNSIGFSWDEKRLPLKIVKKTFLPRIFSYHPWNSIFAMLSWHSLI